MQATEQPQYIPANKAMDLLRAAGIPLSKNTFYEGLGSGQIPSLKIGRRFFVRTDVVAHMENQA